MGVPFNQGNSAIDLLLARRILSPLVTGLFIGLVLTLELSEPARPNSAESSSTAPFSHR
jgi:hypothetical protein